MHNSKRNKIIIFSDFVHDKKHENENEKNKDSIQLLGLIKEVCSQNFGFHFEFYNHETIETSIKTDNTINVKSLFDSLEVNYSLYKTPQNFTYYDNYVKEDKIHFFYRNTHLDSSICKINFSPAYSGLEHSININKKIELGDLYYSINNIEDKENIIYLNTIMANDELYLHYKGSYINQPSNKELVINQVAKEEQFSVNIVFTNVMPKKIATILKTLLLLLLSFEVIYIYHMIKVITKIVKND